MDTFPATILFANPADPVISQLVPPTIEFLPWAGADILIWLLWPLNIIDLRSLTILLLLPVIIAEILEPDIILPVPVAIKASSLPVILFNWPEPIIDLSESWIIEFLPPTIIAS